MKTKPTVTENLTPKAEKAKTGQEPNPIFVCLAGAAYETTRALRLFMGETGPEAKRQFSELAKEDRDEMVDDAMQVLNGAAPPDLYQKYSHGIVWEALDPVEKVLWTTFCATVNLQFEAVKHIAAAAAPKGKSNDE